MRQTFYLTLSGLDYIHRLIEYLIKGDKNMPRLRKQEWVIFEAKFQIVRQTIIFTQAMCEKDQAIG